MGTKKNDNGYEFTYDDVDPGFEPAAQEGIHCDAIADYLGEVFGEPSSVSHELLSNKVHIDILIYTATEDRPFHVLATSGMSDLPMAVPEEYPFLAHAELILALPADWPSVR